jgi:hypothetical protein
MRTISPWRRPALEILALITLLAPAMSVSPAEASSNSNVVHGFAAVSSSDVWATGYYVSGGIHHTLSQQWNGSSWQIVPTPSPGTKDDLLNTPVAISANDVWVVGSQGGIDGEGPGSRTLVEHWDGSNWTVVNSPNVSGANQDILRGAAAASSKDIWAVGRSKASDAVKRTLIEHWTGSSWKIVTSPNFNSEGDGLDAVTAISSSNAWAVGSATLNGTPQALTEHWDGTRWSVVSAPSPGTGGTYPAGTLLWSTAASGSSDVWAVGQYFDGTAIRTLTLHWNGSAWTQISTPDVGSGENQLRGIVALSPTNAWAVGWTNVSGTYQTLVEHWDGTSWSVVPSADAPMGDSYLKGIASISGSDIWAGAYSATGGVYQTLTEHWDGISWSVVPSQDA